MNDGWTFPKYYVTTSENPKLLGFNGTQMYVYEGGWRESMYWRDKILVSDYVNYEEVPEVVARLVTNDVLPHT